MKMIEVLEPRYHDMKVLVAGYKVKGYPVRIKIVNGFYAGEYLASKQVVENSERKIIKSKKGNDVEMICIPYDDLEQIKEEDDEETRLG